MLMMEMEALAKTFPRRVRAAIRAGWCWIGRGPRVRSRWSICVGFQVPIQMKWGKRKAGGKDEWAVSAISRVSEAAW